MIPQYRADMPDQKQSVADANGNMTSTYWLFFRALWSRTGLGTGVPNQVTNAFVATGTAQGDAATLDLDWTEVLTTPANSGVILLAVQPGQSQEVFNGGLNPLKVYPPTGLQIDALAANAAYSLGVGKSQIFKTYSVSQIRSLQLG